MKITDLNIDCLDSCFQHLNIEDLLSVADSNKQLRYLARYTFARKFRRETIRIVSTMNCKKYERIFFSVRPQLIISSLRWSLQFLRCFGDLVPEIIIEFGHDYSETVSSYKIKSMGASTY